MRRLSNRAVIALGLSAAVGVLLFSGGFGPAEWEGRKRLMVDGEYRDTTAERLGGGLWKITCLQDGLPCDARAEAVCGGRFRVESEEVKEIFRPYWRPYRGLPPSEGGPLITRRIECFG